MKNIAGTRMIILLLAFATMVAARVVSEATPAIGRKMKQNAATLQRYTHKRRTEITVKGKSRGARVDLVRYIDGKAETVPLEAPPRPAQSSRARGLRGRMIEPKIENKKEEMTRDVAHLKNLLASYSPGADSMRQVFEKAAISRTGSGPAADIKLVANGVVKPSDSFTLLWSTADHRPKEIEIHADMDGKPVAITLQYAALPDGTFYAAHTVVSAPKKDVTITIDTFDYAPSNSA